MDTEERAQNRQERMQFKVGERVRIRAWDDMLKEYGKNSGGSINTQCAFTSEMRSFCGTHHTVCDVREYGTVTLDPPLAHWNVSVEMIERIGKKGKPRKETRSDVIGYFDPEIAEAEEEIKAAQARVKQARSKLANILKRQMNHIGTIGTYNIQREGDGMFVVGCQRFTTEEMKSAWEALGKRMKWKLNANRKG